MKVREFSLPLETPLSTAAGEIERRDGFVVHVGDGVGEATPLPGWTESFGECRDALAGIEDPASALDDLDEFPAARHGLSLALADRTAQKGEQPLYQYLGGSSTERVPVNATVGDSSPVETARAARKAVSEGFETIKCKVGARPVSEDITRVRAVRNATDSETSLRLDANGGWSRKQADRALRELEPFDIEYVEQPLSPGDLAGHRNLPQAVPIALDESLAGKRIKEIETMADVADILILKPMSLGGVDRTVEIGRRLDNVVITTTIDGVLARTAAVHAAAALDLERPCGLATGDLLAEDLTTDPTVVQDGSISVPQKPGLGVEYSRGEEDA
jgi:o-succinylbenzoate synthase